jgi:purine-nucleoside phosphorylase
MPTPHIAASSGDIARTVLFPGDPDRATYVAERFMSDSVRFTAIRGITGYTGTWEGTRVSVMASGMGSASAGIYSYELYSFYGVERIVRIGTAGGLRADIACGDIVFALSASTDSAYASQYALPGTFSPCADFALLERAVAAARGQSVHFHAGPVFSSDFFSEYNALGPDVSWKKWAAMGCLVQDMETYALYCNAARLGKKALSILTMTDSCANGAHLPRASRLDALEPMIRVALDAALSPSPGAAP